MLILVAISVVLLALSTIYFIGKHQGYPADEGRFSSIDGLRGYLSVGVFIHHASLWYCLTHTGSWGDQSHKASVVKAIGWQSAYTNFMAHIGEVSVAFFFMITGFLFFSKLLNTEKSGMKWKKLYLSRLLRLGPMYFFSVFLVLLVVIVETGGNLNVSMLQNTIAIAHWLAFQIFGRPDINGVPGSFLIMSGVPWSLAYEWMFYLSLPIIAVILRVNVSWKILIVGGVLSAIILRNIPIVHMFYIYCFGMGMLSVFFTKSLKFRSFAETKYASILILAVLLYIDVRYEHVIYSRLPVLQLGLVFGLIVAGNTMFGLLDNRFSRLLGEISYSVYLLHGIFLYVTYTLVIDRPSSAQLSAINYWLIIFAITPLIIFSSYLTYKFIECPPMRQLGNITKRLKQIKNDFRPGIGWITGKTPS